MIAPFTDIVVDRNEERKFRWRALRTFPNEHIEALWGHIQGSTLFIDVFMPFEVIKTSETGLSYEEDELDAHEDEAAEHRLIFLGTIHSHPNRENTLFSQGDLEDSQNTNETVTGICAIWVTEYGKKRRRKRKVSRCAYWPAIRPLKVHYRNFN